MEFAFWIAKASFWSNSMWVRSKQGVLGRTTYRLPEQNNGRLSLKNSRTFLLAQFPFTAFPNFLDTIIPSLEGSSRSDFRDWIQKNLLLHLEPLVLTSRNSQCFSNFVSPFFGWQINSNWFQRKTYLNLLATEAVSLARPFRRRFLRTFRPALVWFRLRNPNFRALLILEGL